MPEVGLMEEDMAEGSLVIMMVVGRTQREPPLALLSGGGHSPTRGEPPLQWMAAEDPSSTLFSLDDAAESLERENMDIGFSAALNALNEASGALREILAPSSGYPLDLLACFLLSSHISMFLCLLISVLFLEYYCS